MKRCVDDILSILDRCAEHATFPMLDNGYVYLAATRLSLFRSSGSSEDWAMVIEVFGFSPRSGDPDLHVQTFSNKLHNRNAPEGYVNDKAYRTYLATNPYNESRFFFPIDSSDWKDPECDEYVSAHASELVVRGNAVPMPSASEIVAYGIEVESAPRLQVFELCRYLAGVARDSVLATEAERRVSVAPEMEQLLQLEEWHHPDLADGELPSELLSFQQLARVLVTGDVGAYRAEQQPNTHWRHWPEGGRL
jgi:hypothetical protein